MQRCYFGLRIFFDVFVGRQVSKRWPQLKRKVAPRLVSMSSGKNGSANYRYSMPRWSSGRMGIADYLDYGPKWFLPIKSSFYLLLDPKLGPLLGFPLWAKIFKVDLGSLLHRFPTFWGYNQFSPYYFLHAINWFLPSRH